MQNYSTVGFGAGNMISQSQHATQSIPRSGLDALVEGSQYLLQQQQQQQQQEAQQASNGMNGGSLSHSQHRPSFGNNSDSDGAPSERKHSSASGVSKGRSSGRKADQPVRRRISRACDQCNQLRTKCDGKQPCAHCVEFSLSCDYARERKKRGKASRKEIAAQRDNRVGSSHSARADGEGTSPATEQTSSPQPGEDVAHNNTMRGSKRRRLSADRPPPQLPPPRSSGYTGQNGLGVHALNNLEQTGTVTNNADDQQQHQHVQGAIENRTTNMGLPTPRLPNVGQDRGVPVSMGDYNTIDDYHRSMLHPGATVAGQNILHSGASATANAMLHGGSITGYGDSPYTLPSPGSQGFGSQFRIGESPASVGFMGQSPMAGSPGWMSLPSPSAALYFQPSSGSASLRYPVLRPLIPHITSIIPIGLACDLLDLFFASTSSAFIQPQSPYILGYLFRKRSFLRAQHPRPCSSALLASMLWVAAQTCESAFLTSPPSARGKICQKLLELTIGLLRPLIHAPNDGTVGFGANLVNNGVALGGFGMALPSHQHELEGGTPGATGALDDVATYINLATVVSASEYKAASLRWWNAAWTMARELKLGRELPPNPEQPGVDGENGTNGIAGGPPPGAVPANSSPPGFTSEEEREERRRIWWLLYTVDRHLALCYNRPLFLLDAECDGLLQPEDDNVWQAGEYYPEDNFTESIMFRRRGPSYQCSGHSIFGYFLPLMTILGEIVDLNHARNHPRFGTGFQNSAELENQAAVISQQLDAYGTSLRDFESRFSHSSHQPSGGGDHDHSRPHEPSPPSGGGQRMTESELQTKIVVAYGTHLMHTLHILLNGKWDPISLLDDNDLWISSQSFIRATAHAVSAAEAINEILEHDPDLSFMPFFFGIYLLQGSFLLLLIADKLQGEASPSVVRACETIVRAHEACVVTLNTEYQRNFRKVMRSALAQVRGRGLEDFGEQQLRRREVLALYRWTGDGTGLAL